MENSRTHPIIPATLGILCSHFFWTAKTGSFSDKVFKFICDWPLLALYIGFGFSYLSGFHPMIIFSLSIIVGHFVFQQKQDV